MKKVLLLIVFLLFITDLCAQAKADSLQLSKSESFIGRGIPYYQNFQSAEYNSDEENWAACQSPEGIMYFANSSGVLEYDGTTWRKIKITNNSMVFGLDIDDSGTVYVGGQDEFGYLEAKELRSLNYVSLKTKLSNPELQFGAVRKVHVTSKGIYFVTDNYVFFLDLSGNVVTIKFSDGLNSNISFVARDTLYMWSYLNGLVKIQGTKRLEVISPETLGTRSISGVIPLKDGLLLASFHHGLFLWKDETLLPYAAQHQNLFNEGIIYCMAELSSGEIALGTYRKGIIIIDTNGRIRTSFDDRLGLTQGGVYNLYQDRQNGLWATLSKGISRMEDPSLFSLYNKTVGLNGSINDCKFIEGKLYAMSSLGGFVMDPKVGSSTGIFYFEPIVGLNSPAKILLSTNFGVLAGAEGGTYLIENRKSVKISSRSASHLIASKRHPNRIWALNTKGIFSLFYDNGKWITEGYLKGYKNKPYLVTPLTNGNLWVGTLVNGVDYIEFPKGIDNQIIRSYPIIKNYSTFSGLPDLEGNTTVAIGEEIVLASTKGLYRFDYDSDKFVRSNLFGSKFNDSNRKIFWIKLDNQGVIWICSELSGSVEIIKGKVNDQGIFESVSTPFTRFLPNASIDLSSSGPEKFTFFYGPNGIIQYDGRSEKKMDFETAVLVRKVTMNDSIIDLGFASGQTPIVPFGKNSINFEYSVPSFDGVSANMYRYQLEGYDELWSEWTSETKKGYTNLSEGTYRFRIKAKNIYELTSKEGLYSFLILPPWYRTWWAYLSYLLLFASFLWIIVKWWFRRLNAKNEALEKLISVRTSEVQKQANLLKVQAEKLQELNNAKSRFLTNISHEFLTPLTLIKGPIERLERNFDQKLNIDTVKMMHRNADRVLIMVNQLLDLAKIDEGSLKLALTEGDVYQCLRAAASSFDAHAAQRNIQYRVKSPPSFLWASFDCGKLEIIVYNLLSNAFKFSDDRSEVSFIASDDDNGLKIQVSDSGKGIAKEKLPFVFDRFYQVEDDKTNEKEGSGIGLSLTKDLVELMEGSITVSSEVGSGTLFTVQLPIMEIKDIPENSAVDAPDEKASRKWRLFPKPEPFTLERTDKRDLPAVLLVEDNDDMRQYIKEHLIDFYRVRESVNGKKGLERALANPPDLIITDLMMPKMDGIELCMKLKTDVNTSHIPVIMLTAKAGMEDKIEGLETGADDYLTKPFDGEELLVRTKNLIQQRQKLRELFSNKEINIDPKKITVTSIDQNFLEQVLNLLEKNFSDPDFGVPQMQNALAMSKTQLHRKLKALTNEAPGELLRNFRLKRAAQLLGQKADSVTQIAYKVGFNNLSYFAKCFKELYGVAPSSY